MNFIPVIICQSELNSQNYFSGKLFMAIVFSCKRGVVNSALVLFFFLLSVDAAAQRTIKGRVVNDVTGAPISGSSVFISNTSKGTTTDNAGQFELNDVPAGKHDLVISCIGYETNVFSFTNDQLPLKLKIELTVKVKEMENVTIEPYVEEGWDKWGKTFMDYFVGTSDNAAFCKIKNQNEIKFRYYKKSNRLTAYANEAVLLENRALGYLVHYQLEDFEINFRESSFLFLGYTLFEEIKARKGLQDRWETGRKNAYKGSITHFMKSLYADSLVQNGFEVRSLLRQPNLEKERVKKIYKPEKTITRQIAGGITIVTQDTSSIHSTDSAAYYRQVMRQKDFTDIIGKVLLTADSLIVKTEGNYKVLYFENILHVTYTKEKEELTYIRIHNPSGSTGQLSYVTLLNDSFITIDNMGNYYNPKDFSTSGYWSWSERMATLVPVDYAPPGN